MPTDNERIERVLDGALPSESLAPQRLHRAMRHATLDGGKRLRARLVYATGRLFTTSPDTLDAAAAAVEMIHAYSLIHDDLPAMDDDDLRRGKPTVHIAFDEATAILAGDALQALAYETLARAAWPDAAKLAALQELISASGSRGMCGGQQLDMDAGGKTLTLLELQKVHALKTGALIKAAIRLPAIVANADGAARTALDAFADDLGLAFQIQDDILDVEASTAQLGKSAGKDAAQAKATYPALLGLDGAKALLAELAERMPKHLSGFGARAEALNALAAFAVARRN
ncbi:farnesyl diphosphate synthase [Arenimonas sp. GDDSR-1]|uniref:polyprenyl synthetase family protein n=1 Tax=Arenimonas sp. GDDSR-1 TaxID=2950125 RepID=UPI00260B72FF|nr:farnesyl diphosphate synthase [Arenimonas sp. GDDSR-1]